MQTIILRGGRPLSGTVGIRGCKNAVLPLLAAGLAVRSPCVLTNVPDILDVHTALEILNSLGCPARYQDHTVWLDGSQLRRTRVEAALCGKMRSSILFLGALLSAAGEAQLCRPGGCVLGKRPIDLHLNGLRSLGVSVTEGAREIACQAVKPYGGTVILSYPSVGATENLLLAAMGAAGPVQILGAAREPEILDLADFLTACGARIYGAGTGRILAWAGDLHGTEYRVMPDRMEAATYLAAAASAGGEITLEQVRPDHLKAVLRHYRLTGCHLNVYTDALRIRAGALRAGPPVRTGPYPAFPTDAQPTFMAAMLRAEGVTVFDETVFDARYRHVEALRSLGANIRTVGSLAAVSGVKQLRGCAMEATDLRGGAAMIAAALGAEGESRITGLGHVLRGYEDIPGSLSALGAEIRITDEKE